MNMNIKCSLNHRRTHRVVERGILSHISNMNFQFWAVLGSRDCRERKKIQTAISMLLLRTIFFKYFFLPKTALKSGILMAVWIFSLQSRLPKTAQN